ncbi:MAG TPA: Co2+/Mg2+ efflux protein ApaG [Phycisphaerales bacterium]|nr:Co2+/Mg2+ efflux protein ApaG [Phycisphaerales bacterium]
MTQAAVKSPREPGSDALTRGVRVRVRPEYLPEHSEPAKSQFVFGYRVRITNEGAGPVRLVSRRWVIVDGEGDERIVEGEGVIGQQPVIPPGEAFAYASYCPLTTAWGTMEGVYRMTPTDEREPPFEAVVARFFLIAPGMQHG